MNIRRALTKGDREVRILSAVVALLLATVLLSPVSCYLEYKDTHRPVDYIRYDAQQPKPLVGLALAAHNFEAYLHDTWNRYARDRMSSRYVADEFHFFIEKNDYNERKLANEGGSDYTRPYLGIFDKALKPAGERLFLFAGSMSKLDLAADRISASWRHTSFRKTHTVTYSCGTSKQPRTCTRTVCDYTDHTFTLDRSGLRNGLDAAVGGWLSVPPIDPEPIDLFHRPMSEIDQSAAEMGGWEWSPLVAGYQEFGRDVQAGSSGAKETTMLRELGSYPVTHSSRNPFCGPPLSYPEGWGKHEAALNHLRATVGVYNSMRSALASLGAASKNVRSAVQDIEAGKGEVAMRRLADLAWEVHNSNKRDRHMSYGAARALLAATWLIVTGLLLWLLWVVVDKISHLPIMRRIATHFD